MNSNNSIACPLDCYDTCQAQKIDENIKGSKENFITNGKLCVNFASLLKQEYLTTARFENEDINLDKAF